MRKSHLHAIIVVVMALILIAGAAHRAEAQPVPNTCCSFSIAASLTIPAACFPITVTTSWGGAVQNDVKPGSGPLVVYPIAGCPPVPATFDWASLDGGVTTFGFGLSGPILLPCGTCVRLRITRDTVTNCIEIHIVRC
jgi:hypothetical protein